MKAIVKPYLCKFINLFSKLPKELVPMSHWERFYGGGNTLRERARTNVYDHLRSPKPIKWLNGLKFMIYPNSDLSRALFVSGTYEPNSLLVVKGLLKENSVFFDVGANAGVFTIAASQWVGSQGLVVSFEPSSREYKLLEENIGLNHLANVRLEKTAISNESGLGMLQIAVDKHNGQNTLCQEFAYENVRSGVVESVDLVTLDKYVNDHGISRLDLIKIDVEGAELRAFQGAENTLKTLRPALIFEIVKSALKKNGIDSEEIESFLVQRNYKLFSIDEETAHLVPTRLSEMRDGNAVALPSENIAYPILGLTQD